MIYPICKLVMADHIKRGQFSDNFFSNFISLFILHHIVVEIVKTKTPNFLFCQTLVTMELYILKPSAKTNLYPF